jgi:hypothetical protein
MKESGSTAPSLQQNHPGWWIDPHNFYPILWQSLFLPNAGIVVVLPKQDSPLYILLLEYFPNLIIPPPQKTF